jgi:hypothetical protein
MQIVGVIGFIQKVHVVKMMDHHAGNHVVILLAVEVDAVHLKKN